MAIVVDSQLLKTALSQRVREFRESRGLTQGELASRAGVRRVTINRLENGHRLPPLDSVASIADALGVTIDELTKTN